VLKEAFRDLEEKPPDGRMRRIREFDAAEERTRQNGLFRVRNHFGTMMCTVTCTVEGP
jgi:hypothetical protein